jgi:subtilase family serine protease
MGNGTRIAIVDAYGDPSLSTDLSTFNSLTGLPPATLNTYYPDGPPKRTSSSWAIETALDVEWAHSIAPSATIDLVVAYDSALSHVFDGIAYVANSLPSETVLSMSFGIAESSYPTTGSYTIAAHHQLFVTITSHGTTPFASSGDSGATSCCDPIYPASDPLVTSVGGTSLTLNPDASYGSETTWSGSGAGSSTVFSKPTWQQGLGDTMRDVVDVSYDGDPNTGVLVVQGGHEYQVGGTSAGSPQWAALMALASQANGQSYGVVNAKLYKISSFHDITTGSDTFFSAGAGWDYPTGLGTPDATMIVNSLSPAIPLAMNDSIVFQGVEVTTTGNLGILVASQTVSGTASVIARNSTTGQVLFNRTYTIPNIKLLNQTGTLQGSFLLSIEVSPYPLSSNISVKETAGNPSLSIQVTRRVDIDGNGMVNIGDLATVASVYHSTLGSPNYSGNADIDANGIVDVADLSIVAFYYHDIDIL